MALTGVLINMDIAVECAIVVTIQDGEYTKFKEYNDGLYYFDTKSNKFEDKPDVIPTQSPVSTTGDSIPKDNINSPVTDLDLSYKLYLITKSNSLPRKLKEKINQENYKNVSDGQAPQLTKHAQKKISSVFTK